MTREERDKLHADNLALFNRSERDDFAQKTYDLLTRIVSALPVSDPAPVADTTELEAAVGELLIRAENVLTRFCDANQTKYDENKWADFAEDPCPIQSLAISVRRVRAAMGRKA